MRLLILAACLLVGSAQAAHDPAIERSVAAPDYQSEWWRLSASLTDSEGRLWGLEWALYRQLDGKQAAGNAAQTSGMSLAHVGITTPDGEYHEQRFEHGSIVRAGNGAPSGTVAAGAQVAGWEWVSKGAELFPARLSFSVGDRDLNLLLESVGGAEQLASTALDHGVSDPLIRVRGFVDQGASKTYLRGAGRLDREWQTPALAGNLTGSD